jgi:hypothetical protein
MRENPDFRLFAYLIITLGAMLSFAAAVVPHYDAGYTLLLSVVFAGLLPYVVYGLISDLVRGWLLLITGVLIFGVDLGVKIPERFLHYDSYASGIIYYARGDCPAGNRRAHGETLAGRSGYQQAF